MDKKKEALAILSRLYDEGKIECSGKEFITLVTAINGEDSIDRIPEYPFSPVKDPVPPSIGPYFTDFTVTCRSVEDIIKTMPRIEISDN